MTQRNYILIFILLLAASSRFYGINWGTDPKTETFHRFHPDETTVVNAAGNFAMKGERTNIPYGKIPVYTLGITARIAGAITSTTPFDITDNSSTAFTHSIARSISALLGTLTVWIVFAIGNRLGGFWVGIGSALLLAFSPTHIQQSHFYTVDITFTFWASLALLLILRLPSESRLSYALCGTVCGLAAGTRLIGILLAIPFILIHFIQSRDGSPIFQKETKRDFTAQFKIGLKAICQPLFLGIATLTAATFTLLGEPDLLLNTQNVTTSRDVFLFSGAVKVATGEMVQIWTLYDYTTLPYVHYFTHQIPQSMGWPAALAGFIGIILAFWYRPIPTLILLSWIIPYLIMVGGLHAKPIRYALPLLPALAILGAWVCVALGNKISRPQWASALPLILICLSTTFLGFAQMHIYMANDSRFDATNWIASNIPKNDTVLVERGGFPTDWMTLPRHRTNPMQGAYFIDIEGFFPYWGQVNFIQSRLDNMQWIVLIKENRMQQYSAVPDRYPIAAAFYQRLESGDLGFEHVADFKTSPSLPFWQRSETSIDPTATAFDHPHVIIYRRKDKITVDQTLIQWAEDVSRDPRFPDALIKKGFDAYRAKSYPTASYHFQQAIDKHPNFVLAYLMLGSALNKQDRTAEAMQVLKKAQDIHKGVSLEAGSGLVLMGMKEEGARFIEKMLPIAQQTGRKDLNRFVNVASKAWFNVGVEQQQAQQYENARLALLRSARLDPGFAPIYIHLGEIAETIGNRDAAIMAYQKFLELNPNNTSIRKRLDTLMP